MLESFSYMFDKNKERLIIYNRNSKIRLLKRKQISFWDENF